MDILKAVSQYYDDTWSILMSKYTVIFKCRETALKVFFPCDKYLGLNFVFMTFTWLIGKLVQTAQLPIA